MKVGVIGCGNIGNIYFKNLTSVFAGVEVKSCADLVMDRAQAKAAQYDIRAVTVDELLADDEIGVVLNLTIPQAHFEVAMKAIEAGKSVYGEKPISLTRDEGKKLLVAAGAKGLRVGNAPDTFMGAGIQTCCSLIETGAIGRPIAANAFMMCHGHEGWHPDPEFYYKVGGGPMFDMGPYYLTALIAMMGPVKSVSGMTAISLAERVIGSEKKRGQKIEVEVPTHVAGLMTFACGAIGTLITSFDVWGSDLPRIEVHGTLGSISVPDPNGFGGPVKLKRQGDQEWTDVPLTHDYAENSRGIGVADMIDAIGQNRMHRANGKMAYHVLDIMHAFHDSAEAVRQVDIESTCEKPAPVQIRVVPE